MKVEVNEKGKANEGEFPKLMVSIDLGFIILAISETAFNISGTILYGNGCWPYGYNSNKWVRKCFQDFEGSITLSND